MENMKFCNFESTHEHNWAHNKTRDTFGGMRRRRRVNGHQRGTTLLSNITGNTTNTEHFLGTCAGGREWAGGE